VDVKNFDAEEFLELVYGDSEGWIDLPAKVGEYWVPFHAEWPADGGVSRRIDSSLRDREDLYYSVAKFANRGRKIEDVLPTHWLWADLDEVHPTTASKFGLGPTIAVESSPGRYQALWRLTYDLPPKTLSKLNRALSYALEADRGGWDLTQVLRIPGTRNFKYPSAPIVRLLWHHEDVAYDPKVVWAKVKKLVPVEELQRVVSVQLPRRPISSRAKALLRTPVDQVVEGERSSRLWELECLLAESGLSEQEIFELVWPSAWNKWQGVATGQQRLKREVHKAVLHVSRKAALKSTSTEEPRVQKKVQDDVEPDDSTDSEDGADHERLPWISYNSFLAMRMEQPKWMVENIWTAASHGIIGGEPKTSKTSLALALALSVASGAPFLNEYAVHTQGPVLFIQEENAPWLIQDRLRKLAAYYGLLPREMTHARKAPRGALGKVTYEIDFPVDQPFHVLNNYGFDLSIEEHRDMLVGQMEEIRPAFLILDPLYLIIGNANYEKGPDLIPYLKWLKNLRYEFNCAIAILHHFGKESQSPGVVRRRPGQRVLGSGLFHGWTDSAIYASQMESGVEGVLRARVETEFRSMAPQRGFEVDWEWGDVGGLSMRAEIRSYTLEQKIADIVSSEPGVTVIQLSEMLSVDKRTVLSRIRGGILDRSTRRRSDGRSRASGGKAYVEVQAEVLLIRCLPTRSGEALKQLTAKSGWKTV
jgi:hypothetical protein